MTFNENVRGALFIALPIFLSGFILGMYFERGF